MLISVEVLFRIKVVYSYLNFKNKLFILDKTKRYNLRLNPNISDSSHIYKGSPQTWRYKINSLGFRGQEFIPNKKGWRILALGDSYTFGWAVDEEEVFTRLLQKKINDKGTNINIFNAGIPGFNTAQEEYLLYELAPIVKPKVVILNYVMNDAEYPSSQINAPWEKYENNILWFLEEARRRYLGISDGPCQNYIESFKQTSRKWMASKTALKNISIYCQKNNIKLVVFIFPDFSQRFDKTYPYLGIHQKVTEWGNEFNIPIFDLLPYFKNENHLKYMIPIDAHPNSLAYKKIAAIVENILRPFIAQEK